MNASSPTRCRFRTWKCFGLAAALLSAAMPAVQAVSILPVTAEQLTREAQAICRGTVLKVEAFRDAANGNIQTRAHIRVDEAFKGRFPRVVQMVYAGGQVGAEGEYDSLAPRLAPGEERLFFLGRRADGQLESIYGFASAVQLTREEPLLLEVRKKALSSLQSGMDTTDQASPETVASEPAIAAAGLPAAPGFMTNSYGLPVRFTAPDRGEPIHYLVDAQVLPLGISQAQALNAVKAAADAWSAATGIQFVFDGVQNFGNSAALIQATDGRIRIQLHDAFNYIPTGSILGRGGWRTEHYVPPNGAPAVTWGKGGNVGGYEFDVATAGFVVLKHNHTSMQNLATFTEVLCHELGHVLGLGHSSESPTESNTVLREAMMFYAAHGDGRGATLGAYDGPTIRGGYPTNNTPPYAVNRVMEVVTVPSGTLNVPGINEIELRGYDLQGTNLSVQTLELSVQTGNFSLTGRKLKFTPDGYYGTTRANPSTSSFYDLLAFRISDGTNASPLNTVRVIWHQPDSSPSTPDGLPDDWMETYWGNASPAAGPNRGPNQDWDGDGFTNLQEFLLGTSPIVASSRLQITGVSSNSLQWMAKPYEAYEVLGTTNLQTWKRVLGPIVPTTSNGVAVGLTNNGARAQFFKVEKVP